MSRFGVVVLAVTSAVAGGAIGWAVDMPDDGEGGERGGEPGGATVAPHVHTTDRESPRTTDRAHGEDSAETAPRHEHGRPEGHAGGGEPSPSRHRHRTLTPYAQRYAAATEEEQAAANTLTAEVEATLAAYEDVDAAIGAGYRPPRDPRRPVEHFLDRRVFRERRVFDVDRPNGLIYYAGGDGDPTLLGAFFIVPPDVPTPAPAGDLVVWHSHNPDCPGFYVTETTPCPDVRRVLHVWTAERVELLRQRTGQTFEARFTDPFGATLTASVTPVGRDPSAGRPTLRRG
jgi:hypothetical protein